MNAGLTSTHDSNNEGELSEARLQNIVGYQVAQAAISTVSAFYHLVGRECDLRPAEYTLLALIRENPHYTLARLADALAVTSAAITLWIDRLEARKLVRRVKSTTDRRALLVRLTPKGVQLVQEATARLIQGERMLYQELSADERETLIKLLQKVADRRVP